MLYSNFLISRNIFISFRMGKNILKKRQDLKIKTLEKRKKFNNNILNNMELIQKYAYYWLLDF